MSEARLVKMVEVSTEKEYAVSEEVVHQVDKIVELDGEIENIKKDLTPLEAQYSALRKNFEATADELVGPEKFVFPGTTGDFEVGKRAKKVSEKNMERIREILGDEVFMQLVDISTTNLRKYLNPVQLAEVMKEEQTGPRRSKVKLK